LYVTTTEAYNLIEYKGNVHDPRTKSDMSNLMREVFGEYSRGGGRQKVRRVPVHASDRSRVSGKKLTGPGLSVVPTKTPEDTG
jgi:hypothetical protein